VISHDDARMLEDAGLCHVWVFELEEGETGEDEAVLKVAAEIACGSCEINLAAGGRANLIASEPCCVLLDDGLLRQINSTASINVATSRNFSFAKAAQRIATVKSAPFVVTAAELDALLSILRERGPVLQARPIRKPTVGVLYTDPSSPDRARQLFEDTLGERLQRLGAVSNFALTSLEQEDAIALCLRRLLYVRPTCILIASTTVPAGPDDAVGRGMNQAACAMVRFLAPVDHGNLLLLGYHDLVPVVSAPGCFRSAKRNVLDLILPPMLARYRLNDWEIAGLGHGGLLA
jgi:molybdenum cofactor cytidylyltransferase